MGTKNPIPFAYIVDSVNGYHYLVDYVSNYEVGSTSAVYRDCYVAKFGP